MTLKRWLLAVACVLLALGANEWTLERFVLADGKLDSPRLRLLLAIFDVSALLAAVLLALGPRLRPPPNWVLVLGSVVVALLGGEFAARWFDSYAPRPRFYVGEQISRPSRNFVADEHTGWRMRPNHHFSGRIAGESSNYRATAEGFRGDGEARTDAGRTPIVLIGDSFAFGLGVELSQTFGALLERELPGVTVYNLAMPGFGIDQMYLSLRHQAPALRPRLVVAAFIDQDFDRSLTAFRQAEGFAKPMFTLEGDTLRPAGPEDRPPWIIRMLERHSWLWTAGSALTQRWAGGASWRLNAALLRAMAVEAREQGAVILFVRLPIRQDPPDQRLLRDLMAELNACYLDLENSALTVEQSLHLTRNSHINPEGHRWVANAILEWVRRTGTIDLRDKP
jgi:hypothetical protein